MYMLVAWLHAVLQERLRFRPVGWTKGYEFGESDQRATFDVVDEWLEGASQGRSHVSPDKIPWVALRTLIFQSTYGGRIDNRFDKSLLGSFLERYFHAGAFDASFRLFDGATTEFPDGSKFEDYVKFVEALPDEESPVWVGLPAQAHKMIATREGDAFSTKLLKMRGHAEIVFDEESVDPGAADVGTIHAVWYSALEKQLKQWIEDLTVGFPAVDDTPEKQSNPLFRFFNRERKILTGLQEQILSDFKTIQSIGTGEQKATAFHRDMIQLLLNETLPKEYKRYNVQTLSATEWIMDLQKRLKALGAVMATDDLGQSTGIWLGGLANPEAYVTATRQYVAQREKVSLHDLSLEMDVGGTAASPNAFLVQGMTLEGASFKAGTFSVADEIGSALPPTQLIWRRKKDIKAGGLEVPAYLNSNRSEFAFSAHMNIPTTDVKAATWYQRGLGVVLWSKYGNVSL
jgi:dynein heavy chain 1